MSSIPNTRQVEEHLTYETAAERLAVTPRTVQRWVALGRRTSGRAGIWPVRKVSRRIVLLPASAINRFLAGNTPRSAA